MEIEKIQCLNCGNKFFVREKQKDDLGNYTICPKCNSSFDINEKELNIKTNKKYLIVDELLEMCKDEKEKNIMLLINYMENGVRKNLKIPMSNEFYIVDEVVFSKIDKIEKENLTNKKFVDLMEKECVNSPNDWGSLYIAPMEHLGNCEIKFNYDIYKSFDENLFEIITIENTENEIIIILQEKEEECYIIDNQSIDICLLETIYNWYIQKANPNRYFNYMNSPKKEQLMKDFVQEVNKQNIIVKIFNNYRDLIEYIFIEGKDKEQLIDSFEKIIGRKYHLTDDNSILQINNKYIYMLY